MIFKIYYLSIYLTYLLMEMIKKYALAITALLFLAILISPFIKKTAWPDHSVLTVNGEGLNNLSLTAEQLSAMPHVNIQVQRRDGTHTRFEGISLIGILKEAGLAVGEDLRGKGLTRFVQVTGEDGYEVVFSLPELDPGFSEGSVILADVENGKPLDAEDGPYRLVVPGEKRQARWVKNVVRIQVMDGR